MSAMDKVNNILGKLPFVKLAGNIPEGIRGKIPFLNVLIPFANHIVSGLVVVILVANIGGGGGVASSKDFSYQLEESFDAMFNHATISAGICITDYSGNGGKVVIPATIEGYPVVSIGSRAFMGAFVGTKSTTYHPANRITELVIPDTVECLDTEAFLNCQNLKSINLPASLKSIGMNTFSGCVELENVTIPDSLPGNYGLLQFFDSNKLPLKTRARIEELNKLKET